mmetsp:Transcript_31882/g.75313  ORF Transcript_31882/g.75313 Transcript_31882/m.75313 type:complete len:338 (-) Transcript_31882:545-1558(-)
MAEAADGNLDGAAAQRDALDDGGDHVVLLLAIRHCEAAAREPSADGLLEGRVDRAGGDWRVDNDGHEGVAHAQQRLCLRESNAGKSVPVVSPLVQATEARAAARGSTTIPAVGRRVGRVEDAVRVVRRARATRVELGPPERQVASRRAVGVCVPLGAPVLDHRWEGAVVPARIAGVVLTLVPNHAADRGAQQPHNHRIPQHRVDGPLRHVPRLGPHACLESIGARPMLVRRAPHVRLDQTEGHLGREHRIYVPPVEPASRREAASHLRGQEPTAAATHVRKRRPAGGASHLEEAHALVECRHRSDLGTRLGSAPEVALLRGTVGAVDVRRIPAGRVA